MNYNHIPPDVMTKYLTDDLSDEERRTAELHIAVCPECAARLDEQRRFEDAAARSYPRTFSGKLDADCEKAIDEAIRERLNKPGDSPFWTKRIRGNVVIQFFTVAAVALLLLLMIAAPTGGAGKKKAKEPASNKAETALAPDKIPASDASAEVKAAETKPQSAAVAEQKAAVPEKKAEEAEPAVEMESLHLGLMEKIALNEVSLRPPEKEPFRKGVVCMESPFEPGALVLLAVTDPKEGPANTGLRIRPEGRTTLLTVFAKEGEDNAVAAALSGVKTNDPAFVFAKVISGEGSLDVSAKNIKSKENAPAPLRLAAVILAAGKPRILLAQREIRKKMIEELRSLAANEYAGSPQVARFLERLEKIK